MTKNYYEYKPNIALTEQYATDFAEDRSWPPESIVSVFFELKESLRSEACKAFSPTTELKEEMRAEFIEQGLDEVFYNQFICDKIRGSISNVLDDIASNEVYKNTAYEHYINASNTLFSIISGSNTIEVTPLGQDSNIVDCSDQ